MSIIPLVTPPPPIITITSTDDTSCGATAAAVVEDDAIDGMLDRISLDLDYLLNRTTEIIEPASLRMSKQEPQQQQQQQSSTTIKNHGNFSIAKNLSVHEVIIEEESEE